MIIDKREFFDRINELAKLNEGYVQSHRSFFEFDDWEVRMETEETEQKLKEIKRELEGMAGEYNIETKYGLKMLERNKPETKEKIKEYRSVKTKLGRLEGIMEKIKNYEDYKTYYINKNGGAYTKGFNWPSSTPEYVFSIITNKNGDNADFSATNIDTFLDYLAVEHVQECYDNIHEKDRQRIRKINYIIKATNEIFRERYKWDKYKIRLDYSYIFLGFKAYISRKRIKIENLDIEKIVEERLQNILQNTIYVERVEVDKIKEEIYRAKEELEVVLYIEELIQKILGSYDLIYKEVRQGYILDIPF
ncbi:hypothetical protein [Tepidimicrobium xylanilyticum]